MSTTKYAATARHNITHTSTYHPLGYFHKMIQTTSLLFFFILQELNRLRRAALCYSYLGLLDVLASMLDKECHKATAEVARQLQHASTSLKAAPSLDLNKPITPVQD